MVSIRKKFLRTYSSTTLAVAKIILNLQFVRKFYQKNATLLEFPFDQETYTNYPTITSPLILISEIQRSGGSLMTQLFDHHEEVYTLPLELLAVKLKWPVSALKHLQKMPFKAPQIFRSEHFLSHVWFGYKKSPKFHPNETRILFVFRFDIQKFLFNFHLNKKKGTQRLDSRGIFDAYFTSFFYSWLNLKQTHDDKKFVVAFAPKTNISLAENDKARHSFQETYPDGFIISIVRNPLDWFASASKHSRKFADFNQAMEAWKKSAEATIELAEQEYVIPVLFDDLIQSTEVVMRKICDKTGLKFDPIMCNPTFNGEIIGSNTQFEQKTGIDNSVLGRGKQLADYENFLAISEDMGVMSVYRKCLELFDVNK